MQGAEVLVDEIPQPGSVDRRPRVLVVDDDPDTLGLLAAFLDLAGFDVTTAADGAEALQVASGGFDVITTDLAMPRMDGGELIQRIRELPINPIPVVVVTAQIVDQSLHERIQSCRIMVKPCDLEELARTLRSLLTTCRHNQFCRSTCPRPLRRS
jgi:CheY-like chemotaxis protein